MGNNLRDEALILRKSLLGESDFIVTLLCRKQGKLSAVAAGARSSRKRFGGCMELFSRIEVELFDKGSGKLLRLQETTLQQAHSGIRANLVAFAQASYLTELTTALVREGIEIESIFCLLSQFLKRLDQGQIASWEIRRYEIRLLHILGILPQLQSCVVCGDFDPHRSYCFDQQQGGIVCQLCASHAQTTPLDISMVQLFQRLASSDEPPGAFTVAAMTELRALMDITIDQHLASGLRARDFLRQLATQRPV